MVWGFSDSHRAIDFPYKTIQKNIKSQDSVDNAVDSELVRDVSHWGPVEQVLEGKLRSTLCG